jgi:hypothetical protein
MKDEVASKLVEMVKKLQERVGYLERLEKAMGSFGWDGSQWRKDPIRIGYSDTVQISLSNTSLAAGSNVIDSGAVPAGEIWILTNISLRYTGTVSSVTLTATIYRGAAHYRLFTQDSLVNSKFYGFAGQWVLKEGDVLRFEIASATAGDDAYLNAVGYRVDIDQ